MIKSNGILAGVIGWPIDHSLSPRLHSYWIKKYHLSGYYVPLAVQPSLIGKTLKSLVSMGFRGVNLTIPHKKEAMQFVDFADPLARQVGAVNTIIIHNDGAIEGRNTDVFGFTENMRQSGFTRLSTKATVIGAGGAAQAVLVGLQQMGFSEIHVINRSTDKVSALGDQLLMDLYPHEFSEASVALEGSELVVNTTSLGMTGQPDLEIDLSPLPETCWVSDIVYSPLETDLLKKASAKNFRTVDGLGMLLHQARPAFKAWFGHDPEVDAGLRKHLLEVL